MSSLKLTFEHSYFFNRNTKLTVILYKLHKRHADGKTRRRHEAISVLWIMDSLRGTGSKLHSCLLWPSLLCTRHNNIHPSCSSVPLFYLFLLLWNPTPQKSVFYPPFNGAMCHRARLNCRWTGTQTAAVQKKILILKQIMLKKRGMHKTSSSAWRTAGSRKLWDVTTSRCPHTANWFMWLIVTSDLHRDGSAVFTEWTVTDECFY